MLLNEFEFSSNLSFRLDDVVLVVLIVTWINQEVVLYAIIQEFSRKLGNLKVNNHLNCLKGNNQPS